MIKIVQKIPIVCDFIRYKSSLDSFSFIKSSFKSDTLGPLFSYSMQQSILKLTVCTLLFSNDCSEAIRQIILIESKVIKTICIVFSVTISFGLNQFPFVKRFIGHRRELKIYKTIAIIGSQFLYISSDFCILNFRKQVIAIYGVVFQLFGTSFALTHFYSKLQNLYFYLEARSSISFKISLLSGTRLTRVVFRNHKIIICYVFLNMFLTNDQERIKKIILKNEVKTHREVQSQLKLKESILKRRKRIERLQNDSVPNLIYIFPRINVQSSSSQSSLEMDYATQQWALYDLKSQNKKNKNYQTQGSVFSHIRCSSTGDQLGYRGQSARNELTHSLKKSKQQSLSPIPGRYFSKKPKDIKDSTRVKDDRSGCKKTDQINLSNYNSRKGDKTTLNSSKRLIVAQQYSLGNQQAKTKKVSQAVTLACRKKQPLRSRIATQHT